MEPEEMVTVRAMLKMKPKLKCDLLIAAVEAVNHLFPSLRNMIPNFLMMFSFIEMPLYFSACQQHAHSPGVDPVGDPRPPEQFAQVLSDTFPEQVTGALALFAAAHHKFIQVGRSIVHRLHGDDSCCVVTGARDKRTT